jgi:predicted secreted hydrolase
MTKGRLIMLVLLVSIATLAYVLRSAWLPAAAPPVSAEIEALQDTTGTEGYARVYGPRGFAFPTDHGPHPEYQSEWWYYTGNLDTADGRHLGYQLTIFRRAIGPITATVTRTSDWATNQVYFAHFAVTDVAGDTHVSTERFSRGAAGLAGATAVPYHVWLEDWQVTAVDGTADHVRLQARDGGYALDLTLLSEKPVTLESDRGYSQKSEQPGSASYYLSFTRMATQGTVTVNGQALAVQGFSWMDHEWSTSALGHDVVGWDWFSIQLADRRELMYYQLRRADGSAAPLSSGTLVAPDGGTQRIPVSAMTIDVLNTWISPHSHTRYPSGWRVQVPSAGLDLTLTPYIQDQEMLVSFVYWEGAVRVMGTAAGNGYVELTGYAAGR